MTWDTDVAHWRNVMEINTIGLFICCKHELKQMLKQESIEVYEAFAESLLATLSDLNTAKKAAPPREALSSIVPL